MGAGGGRPSTTPKDQKQTFSASDPEVEQGHNGAAAVTAPDSSKKATSRLTDRPKDELVTGVGPSFDAVSSRRPGGWNTDELVIGLTSASSLRPPWREWSTSSISWSANKYVPSFVVDPEAPKQ